MSAQHKKQLLKIHFINMNIIIISKSSSDVIKLKYNRILCSDWLLHT